jgi:hypothetical protein
MREGKSKAPNTKKNFLLLDVRADPKEFNKKIKNDGIISESDHS